MPKIKVENVEISFLGIWEEMYNPSFNSPEFGGIMAEAGTNRFCFLQSNGLIGQMLAIY